MPLHPDGVPAHTHGALHNESSLRLVALESVRVRRLTGDNHRDDAREIPRVLVGNHQDLLHVDPLPGEPPKL